MNLECTFHSGNILREETLDAMACHGHRIAAYLSGQKNRQRPYVMYGELAYTYHDDFSHLPNGIGSDNNLLQDRNVTHYRGETYRSEKWHEYLGSSKDQAD
jgi:hypothetical protein